MLKIERFKLSERQIDILYTLSAIVVLIVVYTIVSMVLLIIIFIAFVFVTIPFDFTYKFYITYITAMVCVYFILDPVMNYLCNKLRSLNTNLHHH